MERFFTQGNSRYDHAIVLPTQNQNRRAHLPKLNLKSSGGNCDLWTITLTTEDDPRPMHINENDLIKCNENDLIRGNDNSSIFTWNPKFSPDASKIVVSRKNTFGATAKEKLGQIFTCDLNQYENNKELIEQLKKYNGKDFIVLPCDLFQIPSEECASSPEMASDFQKQQFDMLLAAIKKEDSNLKFSKLVASQILTLKKSYF